MKLEQLGHSTLTGNYYWVKTGKKLSNAMLKANDSKIDVTDQVKLLILKALDNQFNNLCLFCDNQPEFTQDIISKIKKNFSISLCSRCEVPKIKGNKEEVSKNE